MSNDSIRSLLVIEDNPGLQKQLKWSFDDYNVLIAGDRPSALRVIKEHKPAVITLDLGLPPDPANATEGLAALEDILSLDPYVKVVVVTGNDDRDNALKAIELGAYDFYQKPIDNDVLKLIVGRAFHVHDLEMENRQHYRQMEQAPLRGIIAASQQMLKVCRQVEKIAPVDVSVLILGDSGTGKEVIARALHELSPRAAGRFVAINCAAIPENLLESELFGYEKGAFTGAAKQTMGKIELADGGTLFLDEIGDLSMALQAKLLRFLQERVIERVGGRKEIPVDVRVICATHQDIPARVEQEQFRGDLYYRISEITINLPPLRERDGDAVLLARVFMKSYAEQHGKKLKGFTTQALAAIDACPWTGNVRELENKIKRAVIMAEGAQITVEDLELDSQSLEEAQIAELSQVREKAERQAIQRAIGIFNNNVSRVAKVLGVSRPTLYALMDKYGLK